MTCVFPKWPKTIIFTLIPINLVLFLFLGLETFEDKKPILDDVILTEYLVQTRQEAKQLFF